jgi:hypothetical protein
MKEGGKFLNGEGIHAITGFRPIHLPLNQPGFPQNLQMLGNSGLRQRKHLNDLSANALVAFREDLQDGDARRMRQSVRVTSHLGVSGFEFRNFRGCHEFIYRIFTIRSQPVPSKNIGEIRAFLSRFWTVLVFFVFHDAASMVMQAFKVLNRCGQGHREGTPLALGAFHR